MLIIDAHAHAYSEDENRYPPIENPIRPPDAAGSFLHLQRVMRQNNVSKVCAIQPGTFYKWDNRFICDLASANEKSAAAICALDPDNSRSPTLLAEYVKQYGIRGLRSYPASDGRVDHPGVRALWKAAGEAHIVVNIFIGPEKTDELIRLLESFPEQPVVIDHCLNLKADSGRDGTLRDMTRIGRFPHAHAKLSFMPMGSNEPYPFRDVHECCHRIIDVFTPDRCVWGSNFPPELWTPKATYSQHLNIFLNELKLSEAAKTAILGRTAQRLWFAESAAVALGR